MYEQIIGSLITLGIVTGLIGLVFKMKSKEIDNKVNKEACDLMHASVDEKFKVLFENFEKQMDKMNEIHTDVQVIKKGMNGE